MDRTISIYLDLVRLLMALTVLTYHLGEPRVGGNWIRFPQLGTDAVIVFFVLSGYVIAYAAEREASLKGYMASRLARLWSVLIPALILTIGADWIGRSIDPDIYNSPLMGWDDPVVRSLISLSFTNEIWFSSTTPFSNIPVWSLGFEFWYYVLFGLWVFLFGVIRWLCIGLVALIVGPKVLLLMPIWIVGVILYGYSPHRHLSTRLGLTLCVLPIMLFLPMHSLLAEPLRQEGNHLLGLGRDSFADYFLWGYVLGALVACHLIGFFAVSDKFAPLLAKARKPIGRLAGFTLSIYLLHFPLLLLFSALLHNMQAGVTRTGLIAFLTLGICIGLGILIEPRKTELKRLILGVRLPTPLSSE